MSGDDRREDGFRFFRMVRSRLSDSGLARLVAPCYYNGFNGPFGPLRGTKERREGRDGSGGRRPRLFRRFTIPFHAARRQNSGRGDMAMVGSIRMVRVTLTLVGLALWPGAGGASAHVGALEPVAKLGGSREPGARRGCSGGKTAWGGSSEGRAAGCLGVLHAAR